jgi:hypothetical protein
MKEARNVPNFLGCDVDDEMLNADAMDADAADERPISAGRFRTLRGKSRLCQPRRELYGRNPNADAVYPAPAGENAMLAHVSATLAKRIASLFGMTRMLPDEVGMRQP